MIRNMKICDECGYWHTLVDGIWQHVRPEVKCTHTESTVMSRPPDSLYKILVECQHCGEPTAESFLDDIGNCSMCHWNEEPDWSGE